MMKSAFLMTATVLLANPFLEAQDRKPAGDRVRLNAEPLATGEKTTFNELLTGKIAVDDSHKDLLKRQAQFLVYPVTHEEIQFKQTFPETGKTLKQVLDETFRSMAIPTPQKPLNENQVKFMREFGKALVAAIKEVLSTERPIARVNGAIILAKLGETGIDDFADPMCEIIAGPNHDDTVKLYALSGLKHLFEAKGEDRVKDDARESRAIKALTAFIQRKPPFDPGTRTPEEVEALRYVRREAIRALGETHVPAIGKAREINVDAVPSYLLLQIVANTAALQPPLSLAERVEAAIGLAQMQRRYWPENNEYQPEYAGYFIGKLVAEFAQAYDKERAQASATDWKYLAYRLAKALAEMKKESLGKWPKLDGVIDRSIAVLNGVVSGGGTDQVALVNFLDQNPPDAKELLRKEPDTAIKPAAPAENKASN